MRVEFCLLNKFNSWQESFTYNLLILSAYTFSVCIRIPLHLHYDYFLDSILFLGS
jgi:ABC-type proline/glycine betaine transport system permease subunit